MKRNEQKFNMLPPDLLMELETYMDFLLQKIKTTKKGKLKQNWAGSMKKYKTTYTSIELQKKSLEWRSFDKDFRKTNIRTYNPIEVMEKYIND